MTPKNNPRQRREGLVWDGSYQVEAELVQLPAELDAQIRQQIAAADADIAERNEAHADLRSGSSNWM